MRTSYGYRREYEDLGLIPARAFHATAADRITATEARLGRKVWAARELPDDMCRALWWKQRRWMAAVLLACAGDNDGAFNAAFDAHAEAESAHELLIREMWLRHRLALEDKAWAALASVGTALNAIATDSNINPAFRRAVRA